MIKDKIIEILDRLPEEEQQHVLDYAALIERRYQFNWNLFGKGVEITDVFEEPEKIIALFDSEQDVYIFDTCCTWTMSIRMNPIAGRILLLYP